MESKHVAFCLDQAYGNIVPTLGIASKLVLRGHRVSYTVPETFAPIIRRVRATPVIIEPMDIRGRINAAITIENDCFRYVERTPEAVKYCRDLSRARTENLLSQLEVLYRDDPPDLVLHDDSLDTAGRELADKWGLKRIRHHSQYLDKLSIIDYSQTFAKDELVLMTVPEFFQRDRQTLDERFRFVGFVPEGRFEIFEPWQPSRPVHKPILVSATTGLLPQRSFYQAMIGAVRDQPWDVILSISGSRDRISAIAPEEMSNLPRNVLLNASGSNFDIVKHCGLYIGQGGQGGVLEAIYWGVPQIVIPPEPYHYSVGRRVAELDLGICLAPAELSIDGLRQQIAALLANRATLERVQIAGESMRTHSGAPLAVEIIEGCLEDCLED